MLTSLWIKNVALIEELKVEFGAGLNVLSGETGAGKSILIDSLNFVLGGKADRNMLGSFGDRCRVEAVIEQDEPLPEVNAALEELGAEPEETIILSRGMDNTGKNRCAINGHAVTVATLKNFSALLADIHGQSEHQQLLKVSSHLELIDRFGKLHAEKAGVAEVFAEYKAILRERKGLGGDASERERALDLLNYQIEEISAAELTPGEEEELAATRKKAMNVERILSALNGACEALRARDGSCLDLLSEALSRLSAAAAYDEEAEELRARLESARYEIEDVADTAADLLEGYDFDERDLERIERRLETLRLLKRKYGGSVEEVLEFLTRAQAERDRLENAEAELARLNAALEKTQKKLYAAAEALSAARRGAAEGFQAAVMAELTSLGLGGADFKVEFSPPPSLSELEGRITANGFDDAEFYMSANPGQPLKPLAKVISGGEASRFMLAVKTITAELDGIPLLVFDEIDTGISGGIAQMVAEKFALISRRHQLLAITHLAPIAAMGDCNLLIEKSAEGGVTRTFVKRLNSAGKEAEVARLGGGAGIGEHGLLHARELVAWCDAFKAGKARY